MDAQNIRKAKRSFSMLNLTSKCALAASSLLFLDRDEGMRTRPSAHCR